MDLHWQLAGLMFAMSRMEWGARVLGERFMKYRKKNQVKNMLFSINEPKSEAVKIDGEPCGIWVVLHFELN